MKERINGNGFGEAVATVFRDTNLLDPQFEVGRVTELLRSPSADAFIHAAARFTLGGGSSALAEMASLAKPHECAKWTAITYLPFLWRPETHMFLKPAVTRDFAARVGHSFFDDYKPELDMAVYQSLLDLAARTEAELTELAPQDRIDVQSFIWVVGKYDEANNAAAE